jgi:superfamily II DNA or RNA helicase
MSLDRETIIRDSLNKWYKRGSLGVFQLPTGFGKTYAGILAAELFIKRNPNDKVLIVCPTDAVIINFKNEFKKFKRNNLLLNCKFICYASILKEIDYYSLIILDEVHHIVTENKLQFFKNIKTKSILGLSASLTVEQIVELNKVNLPIIAKYTLEDAQKGEFIAEFTIINMPIELTQEERIRYTNLTSRIEYVKNNLGVTNWGNINKRKSIVNNAINKFNILKSVVDLFKDEYGIIFTLEKVSTNKAAELIGPTCLPIHSGISKKLIEKNLKAFSDGRSKVKQLATAKMLDEGVTLPRLTYSVSIGAHSTEKQNIQRSGRAVRTDIKNKHSILIRLYCRNTIEEGWVRDSQNNFKVKYVRNYDELKNTISEIRSKTI